MKVGDYVRTNDGIGKITKYTYEPEYENCHVIWLDNNDYGIRYTNKELSKSSPNIIDLIEVGDYINGMLVHCVYAENDEIVVGSLDYFKSDCLLTLRSSHIKSIVTKEQFESMEYRIGE